MYILRMMLMMLLVIYYVLYVMTVVKHPPFAIHLRVIFTPKFAPLFPKVAACIGFLSRTNSCEEGTESSVISRQYPTCCAPGTRLSRPILAHQAKRRSNIFPAAGRVSMLFSLMISGQWFTRLPIRALNCSPVSVSVSL